MLSEMLAAMDSGIVFSIQFISHDKKRTLKNGRTVNFSAARLERSERDDADGRVLNTLKSRKTGNFTRTIRIYANGRPTSDTRTFHPLLVEVFDGKELFL